jgi:hypothetical protein
VVPARSEYEGFTGFAFSAGLRSEVSRTVFSVPEPVHLLTAFFRVKGRGEGEAAVIRDVKERRLVVSNAIQPGMTFRGTVEAAAG